MIDNQFILYHYWWLYSNECAFWERTVVRGRQRKFPGAKIRNWLFSRSVDPNSAIPLTHLGIFTKSWWSAPRHCNWIHLVHGEAVAWHWDFWHFPGDPKVQQSWGTLNWAARILSSWWCTEPGLLKDMSMHRVHIAGRSKPTVHMTFDWLTVAVLVLLVPKKTLFMIL